MGDWRGWHERDDDGDDPRYQDDFDENDYGADPFDDCDHKDYGLDWDGRATCYRCGYVWYLDTEDFKRMAERDKRIDEEFKREAWRAWRQEWADRLCFWRRWTRPKKDDVDDEIPF